MIRTFFLILYAIIPDTEAAVAPTAFLHIKKKQLKLHEAKKKQHTVTEKISDLTKERDSIYQQVGQSKLAQQFLAHLTVTHRCFV